LKSLRGSHRHRLLSVLTRRLNIGRILNELLLWLSLVERLCGVIDLRLRSRIACCMGRILLSWSRIENLSSTLLLLLGRRSTKTLSVLYWSRSHLVCSILKVQLALVSHLLLFRHRSICCAERGRRCYWCGCARSSRQVCASR
jgi:hypothetical protein